MILLPRAEGWDQMSLSSPVTIRKQKQEEEFHSAFSPQFFSLQMSKLSLNHRISVPQLTHMNTKTHANDTSNSFAPTSLIQQQHLL